MNESARPAPVPRRGIAAGGRWLVAAAALASCSSKRVGPSAADAAPRPTAGPAPAAPARPADGGTPDTTPAAPPLDAAAARALLRPLARAIDRVLCPEAKCVTDVIDFGRDGKGQELFVAELYGDAGYLAAPPPRARRAGSEAKDEGRTGEDGDAEPGAGEECVPAEYHLVARKGKRIREIALLAKSCNRAPDMPEAGDIVEVDREHRLISQSWGGGNVIWTHSSMTMGVEPLRLVGFRTTTMSRVEPDDETDRSWDWDELAGTTTTAPLDCKPRRKTKRPAGKVDGGAGQAGEGAGDPKNGSSAGDDGDGEGSPPRFSVRGALIPDVDLPADFLARGWRATALGTCAAGLDFTTHGGATGDDDASARVVIANHTLFVEVSDDRFVGPGKSWVADDHLELWIGRVDEGNASCEAAVASPPVAQWGIRVADGAVFPAHGGPAPLAGVERVVAGRTARFKVPLPRDKGDRITVVYSDSDDGRVQKHLIATSELRFGVAASLGETFPVSAEDGKCVVKGGALQPIRVPLKIEGGPILRPP